MNNSEVFENLIENNLHEINDIIDCLYITTNFSVKNRLLNLLRKDISNLSMLMQGIINTENFINPQLETKLFTETELSKYNGRNGNPAYIAVNGVVYDVTNTAAWGGASHFGLVAGSDVTSQFATCHAGQPILNKLKVVGKMEE